MTWERYTQRDILTAGYQVKLVSVKSGSDKVTNVSSDTCNDIVTRIIVTRITCDKSSLDLRSMLSCTFIPDVFTCAPDLVMADMY